MRTCACRVHMCRGALVCLGLLHDIRESNMVDGRYGRSTWMSLHVDM